MEPSSATRPSRDRPFAIKGREQRCDKRTGIMAHWQARFAGAGKSAPRMWQETTEFGNSHVNARDRERAARTYAQVARLRFRRSRAPRTPGFPNSVISCHAGVDPELSCPSLSPIQLAESVRRIERARTMQWRRVRCRTVGHSRGSEGEAGKRAERASRFTLSRGRAGTRG